MSGALLEAFGISVRVPDGWEARIYRRAVDDPTETAGAVLHAATFALPAARGDYGAGAVEQMGPGDVFVALFDHGPVAARQPLFRWPGIPRLEVDDFTPGRLQRALPGQSGTQLFFNQAGRGLCLYVVLGAHARRDELVARANALLDEIAVAVEESEPSAEEGGG